MKPLLVLLLCLPLSAHPRWLRWASAAVVCASSGLDMATTAYAVGHGAVEQDPLLVRGGKLSWGRLVAFDSASCGGALFSAASHRVPTKASAPLNFGIAGVKVWAGAGNLGTIRRLKQ